MELETSRPMDAAVPANNPSKMHSENKKSLADICGGLHFVGIGGIGMSALARLLLAQGRKVSGSDKSASPITDELKELGAEIYIGHKADNLGKSEALVVSTAINKENPEYALAIKNGLPVFHRSDVLSYLAAGKKTVAVSGTHGKTTCTGMIAQLMIECGRDPSVVVGGVFSYLKSNSRAGKSDYFVAEADESDRTHASLPSEIALVTNIETDHMENYPGGFQQILSTMASFASKARKAVVLCGDDAGCLSLKSMLEESNLQLGLQSKAPSEPQIVSYGKAESNDYWFKIKDECRNEFEIYNKEGRLLGSCKLAVPGLHNVYNALAAITVCAELGMDVVELARAASAFRGVARRFDIIGEAEGVLVVDDYGHHPSELKATLKAAKQFIKGRASSKTGSDRSACSATDSTESACSATDSTESACTLTDSTGSDASSGVSVSAGSKRVVVVFQPHQPGRLRDLWKDFCSSFADADLVLLADVYVARGGQIEGVNSETFAKHVEHENVHYLPGTVDALPEKIFSHLLDGDLVLTVGAGDITNLGKPLLALISEKGLAKAKAAKPQTDPAKLPETGSEKGPERARERGV